MPVVPVSPAFRETFRKVGADRVAELVPGIADLVRQGRHDAEIVEWVTEQGLGRGFAAWLVSKVRDHGEELTFDLETDVVVEGRTYRVPRIHLDLIVGGLFFTGLVGHVLYNVAEDQRYLASHPDARNLPSRYMLLGLIVGLVALLQMARREALGLGLALGLSVVMGVHALAIDQGGAAAGYAPMTMYCLMRFLGFPRDKNAEPTYWRVRQRRAAVIWTIVIVLFGRGMMRSCARKIDEPLPTQQTDHTTDPADGGASRLDP